jgi:hypothetical protein
MRHAVRTQENKANVYIRAYHVRLTLGVISNPKFFEPTLSKPLKTRGKSETQNEGSTCFFVCDINQTSIPLKKPFKRQLLSVDMSQVFKRAHYDENMPK